MTKNTRRPFRSLMYVLFFLLIGGLFILPFAGMLIAKQDATDAPDRVEFAVQALAQGQQSQASAADTPFAVTLPQTARNFAVTRWNAAPLAGFSNADPMQQFVEKIRDADTKEAKQEAIDQAKAALEKHYDKYIDGYEKQVDEMESRLKKLRDQLDKRKEAKDKLVGLKLEMITSQADGIGWPEDTDRINVQRFPGTLWRTSPPSPSVPSGLMNVPAPSAPAEPAGVYFRSASPPGAAQSARLTTSATPFGTYSEDPFAAEPQTARAYSIAKGAVVSAGNLETAVFNSFFENGIQLLEQGKYGEFLDRYLQPEQFRKELKSATLDDVSKKFAEESADSILAQFRAAMESPVTTYNPKTETFSWKNKVDGEMRQLTIIREGDQWYLSLQEPEQDDRPTR